MPDRNQPLPDTPSPEHTQPDQVQQAEPQSAEQPTSKPDQAVHPTGERQAQQNRENESPG